MVSVQFNGRFCLNLSGDVDGLATMTDEELRAELARKPCPVRRLRTNAAPTLTALYDAPEMMLDGVDIDVIEARARRVKDDPALCSRLVSAYTSTREPRTQVKTSPRPATATEPRPAFSFSSGERDGAVHSFSCRRAGRRRGCGRQGYCDVGDQGRLCRDQKIHQRPLCGGSAGGA